MSEREYLSMRRAILVATVMALGACGGSEPLPEVAPGAQIEVLGAFESGEDIPRRFTCDGADTSPPLRWERVTGAASYALVVHDIDADDFVHWVTWSIPPSDTELPAGELPRSAIEGTNSFGEVGYGGPCPPPGDEAHTYVFTLYAVGDETNLGLNEDSEAEDVLDAIEGSVIASGELRGTYDR